VDIIPSIASTILVIGCIYFVLSPLTSKKLHVVDEVDGKMDNNVMKEELYATLNEIEMDYKMNKLSEEDYLTMKKKYEHKVAEIMKNESTMIGRKKNSQKESAENIKKIEDEIDQELAALRKERRPKS